MTRKSAHRGHIRPTSELSDKELIASAWRELRKKPDTASSGCIRAIYTGGCRRCQKPIAVGQEIHRVRGYAGYVHLRCRRPAEVLEGGKPHTVTVRRISTVANVCGECHLEHRGPCDW